MKSVLSTLLLSLFWVFATGTFTFLNLFIGFLIAFAAIGTAQRTLGNKRYFFRVWSWFRLGAYFIWELALSNLRLAHDILTPCHRMRSGVVGVPLSARSDAEITLLASMVSLTPGTLSLDLSSDRKTLFVHAMYISDVEQFRRRIKSGLELRILQALRAEPYEL